MAVRSAAMLRANEAHSAITNFCNLWFKGKSLKQSQFAKLMQDLVVRKNDFKHDRGPQTPYEYSEATHGLNQKLRECLRELAFLVQHPMRLVQDFDIDWKTRQTVLSTLVYVGDHPGLRQENILVRDPLPKDKLYLELRLGQLSALYPLISAQYSDFSGRLLRFRQP